MIDHVRRPNLVQYWSIRYFLIISVCVAIMIVSSIQLIRISANHNQIRGLEAMARDVASMAMAGGGSLDNGPALQSRLESLVKQYGLSGRPILFILDNNGHVKQQRPSNPPEGAAQFDHLLPQILAGSARVLEWRPAASNVPYVAAVQPMVQGSSVAGYVLYLEKKQTKPKELFANSPRFILLVFFLLAGWVIVYSMTRRLISPVLEVAGAAQQVVAGSYDIHLKKDYKEAEVYDLTHSFSKMADRLAHLEALRAQLLTGITKELKTPVISIHRKVQAVKNREVDDEEMYAYLEDALEESRRMQNMVDNLLEFNRVITGEVSVTRKNCDLNGLVTEVIDRWTHAQHDNRLQAVKQPANDRMNWTTWTDPMRVEQVLVNLLDNAKDAMANEGSANVQLQHESDEIRIHVRDTGRGISHEEYADIFEPFYRGRNLETQARGLGIGLPFSRIIARSLGGDLILSDGTPGKTTFTLILPYNPATP